MKEQFDDKAKDTTTIKSMPVEQTKASKDELSEQELDKATGGTAVGPRGGVYHRGELDKAAGGR
jgi:hypothetical protein